MANQHKNSRHVTREPLEEVHLICRDDMQDELFQETSPKRIRTDKAHATSFRASAWTNSIISMHDVSRILLKR